MPKQRHRLAAQFRGADLCLCFHYIDGTILLPKLKCQTSNHCLWLCSLVCVGPGRKPQGHFSDDKAHISVADIPGLIPGAHQDKGLGISFLRHIQRCTCLLYVIDLSESKPWHQLETLKYELEQYEEGLSERPHAVIGNKMDLEIAKKNLIDLQNHTNLPVFPLSAMNRSNIKPLLLHLRELYDKYSEKQDVGW